MRTVQIANETYDEDSIIKSLHEVKQWRENVEYMLNDPKFAPYVVRVCEGGGEEDLIMSLVVSWNKMFNATPAGEYLKPGGGRFS